MNISVDSDTRTDDPSRAFQRSECGGVLCRVCSGAGCCELCVLSVLCVMCVSVCVVLCVLCVLCVVCEL